MHPLTAVESLGQSQTAQRLTQSAAPARQTDFMAMLTSGIETLDGNIAAAEHSMNAFSLGDQLSTHELMIAMEKARFSMQVAVEIRNRLAETYAELTRMQV